MFTILLNETMQATLIGAAITVGGSIIINIGIYASKIMEHYANRRRERRDRTENVLSELVSISDELGRIASYCAAESSENTPNNDRLDASNTIVSPERCLYKVRVVLDRYMEVSSKSKIKVLSKSILDSIYVLNIASESLYSFLSNRITDFEGQIDMSGFQDYKDVLIIRQEELYNKIRKYLK